jgi:hypothetical protein
MSWRRAKAATKGKEEAMKGKATERQQSNITARVTRRFRATPRRVFDAWLDPAQVRLWLGAAAQKEALGELARVELDPHVGGTLRGPGRLPVSRERRPLRQGRVPNLTSAARRSDAYFPATLISMV